MVCARVSRRLTGGSRSESFSHCAAALHELSFAARRSKASTHTKPDLSKSTGSGS